MPDRRGGIDVSHPTVAGGRRRDRTHAERRWRRLGAVARAPAAPRPAPASSSASSPTSLGNPFIQQIIDGAQFAADGPRRRPPGHGPRGRRRRRAARAHPGARRTRASRASRRPSRAPSLADAAQRDHRRPASRRAVQPARQGRECPVRRRALRGERPHPRPAGHREARRRRRDRQGHHRQLLPRLPGPREPRRRASRRRSPTAPGLDHVLGPFDVKVAATENYAAWEALLTANPDAVALIGLCAPDVASLGKLQAANPETRRSSSAATT